MQVKQQHNYKTNCNANPEIYADFTMEYNKDVITSLLTLWFCLVYFQMPHYLQRTLKVQMARYDDSFLHVSYMHQQPL